MSTAKKISPKKTRQTKKVAGRQSEHDAAWDRFEKLADEALRKHLERGGKTVDSEGISEELGRTR